MLRTNAEEIYLRYITEYDDKDLEALLAAYRDGLYLFLLGYVKNEEDAEELMMDPSRSLRSISLTLRTDATEASRAGCMRLQETMP